MTPNKRPILTEESVNVDSGSFPEIQDLHWDFRYHRLSTRTVTPELERIPHTCDICSSLHIILTFQSYIWIYDWLRTHVYRIIWKTPQQIPSLCRSITQLTKLLGSIPCTHKWIWRGEWGGNRRIWDMGHIKFVRYLVGGSSMIVGLFFFRP